MEEPFVPSLDTRPFGTPLRRFKGILKEYISEKRTASQEGGKDYMVIDFNFTDVEVLESVEPFPFPIATLSVSYSTSENTRWSALAGSIKSVLGLTPTLDDLTGKPQEWAYLPAELRQLVEGVWKNIKDEAWQVVSVEGAGEPGATGAGDEVDGIILNMVDGKNEQDFYQEFYANEEVRKHPNLITAATNRQLLTSLEAAGKISRDNEGIWHKV